MLLHFSHNFIVYITGLAGHKNLHIGCTGDITAFLQRSEHAVRQQEDPGQYNIIYWEFFPDMIAAASRENELQRMSFKKKIQLVSEMNPSWRRLNGELSVKAQVFRETM